MSCHTRVDEWTTIIHTHLPHLSKPQAAVLALWSLGMVLARSCALTAVSLFLATGLSRKSRYRAAAVAGVLLRSRGQTRADAPAPGGGDLLCAVAGVGAELVGGTQLALAIDATTLGNALWCWWSAWCIGAVPFPWRGRSCRPRRNTPGAANGCACCASCGPRCRGRGPSSSWPIGACMPAGCFGASCGWAGIRSCASTRAGRFAPRPAARSSRCETFVPAPDSRWRGTGTAFKGPQPAALYAAGPVGGGLCRPLAVPDRLAARGRRRGLVWPAGVDRAGLQDHQTRRLAVAAHPHDRSRARRAPMVGGGGRHPVVAQRRRGGGGRRFPASTLLDVAEPLACDFAARSQCIGTRMEPLSCRCLKNLPLERGGGGRDGGM